jgi:7,8-dihydro-6-hydroxymethylpterin-pyrophosphokinase
MAATTKTNTVTDEQLLDMLMNGTGSTTSSVNLRDLAADAAATSLKTASVIAGAFTGAWDNAKIGFRQEANFRNAANQISAKKDAERYLARLKAIAQG